MTIIGMGRSIVLTAGFSASIAWGQAPAIGLYSRGNTLVRVNQIGEVEVFSDVGGRVVAMTVIPVGVGVTGCVPGDVIAMSPSDGGSIWKVVNAREGVPSLSPLGTVPEGTSHADVAFADGKMYVIGGGTLTELNPVNFQVVQTFQVHPENRDTGGLAFDGMSSWYVTDSIGNHLARFGHPPASGTWTNLEGSTGLGVTFGNSDLEWHNGKLYGALQQSDGAGETRMLFGTFVTTPGSARFNTMWVLPSGAGSSVVGLAVFGTPCYTNCDESTSVPILTGNDFQCFLNRFVEGSSYANCDASTTEPILTANDFVCFLNAFVAGCE